MSSLRRRAICVQRAMSTERSSIGGRARARTTAGASVGSANNRSHASTSRISARRKNAVSPTSRWDTARSSSATATAWPSRATLGTSTAIRPGDTPSPAINRSTSTATAWAWARSLAHRQKAISPSTDAGSNDPRSTTAPAARIARRGTRRLQSNIDHARPGCLRAQTKASRVAEASAPGRPATVRRDPRRPLAPAVADASEKSCASSTSTARTAAPQPAARAPPAARSRIRSPASRAPASASSRSWTSIHLGELLLDAASAAVLVRARLGQPRSPARVLLRPHQMRLEPVDPADEPAEQGVGAARRNRGARATVVDPARAAWRTAPPGRAPARADPCRPADRLATHATPGQLARRRP